MTKISWQRTGLCLALTLICTLLPKPACADDREKVIRLYASDAFGPIGRVYSLGAFVIDERLVYGEQTIWGGELIQTPDDLSATVLIDSAGQITLKNAAMARFATSLRSVDDTKRPLLVATLINGDIAVKLKKDAAAYIESCGSTFTSTSGASFGIRIQRDKAVLSIASGAVDVQASRRPPNIKGRTVRLVANRPPVPLGQASLDRKTGQSAQATSQWSKYYEGTGRSGRNFSFTPRIVLASYQTAPQSTQVEDLPAGRVVNFHLEPPTLGTLIPDKGTTDKQGVINLIFKAGNIKVSGHLVGDIVPDENLDPPGTTYEQYRRPVNVTRLSWWRTRNLLLAAAVVGTIVIVKHPKKGPIQQAPPPMVIP